MFARDQIVAHGVSILYGRYAADIYQQLSYRRWTARRAVSVKTVLNVRRIAFDKSCIKRMTFKVIQDHLTWHE